MVHELVQVFTGELKLTEPLPLMASDRRFTGSITVTFCFATPLPDAALTDAAISYVPSAYGAGTPSASVVVAVWPGARVNALVPKAFDHSVGALAPRLTVCDAQELLSLFFTDTLNVAVEPYSVAVPVGEAVAVGAAATQGTAP